MSRNGGIDTLRLTAEQVAAMLAGGEVSGQELFAAYRAASYRKGALAFPRV